MQSEHWVTKQATIFASVVGWLSLSEWEKRAGELGVGDEVTVHGEQHGQPVALGFYWGRIAEKESHGYYQVEDKAGDVKVIPSWNCDRLSPLRQKLVFPIFFIESPISKPVEKIRIPPNWGQPFLSCPIISRFLIFPCS